MYARIKIIQFIIRIIFIMIPIVCFAAAYAWFRLWQGNFAGSNYMKNEYGIDPEEDNEKNDDYYRK